MFAQNYLIFLLLPIMLLLSKGIWIATLGSLNGYWDTRRPGETVCQHFLSQSGSRWRLCCWRTCRGKLKERIEHSRQKEPSRLRVTKIAFGTVLFLPLAFYFHATATQVNGCQIKVWGEGSRMIGGSEHMANNTGRFPPAQAGLGRLK